MTATCRKHQDHNGQGQRTARWQMFRSTLRPFAVNQILIVLFINKKSRHEYHLKSFFIRDFNVPSLNLRPKRFQWWSFSLNYCPIFDEMPHSPNTSYLLFLWAHSIFREYSQYFLWLFNIFVSTLTFSLRHFMQMTVILKNWSSGADLARGRDREMPANPSERSLKIWSLITHNHPIPLWTEWRSHPLDFSLESSNKQSLLRR
jgi:hypothetical protein